MADEPVEENQGAASDSGTSGAVEPDHSPYLREDPATATAQKVMSAFLIVIAGAVIYSDAISLPLHGADLTSVSDNSALHTLRSFPDAARPRDVGSFALFTIALNLLVAGASAASFHVINMSLHVASGVMVYFLCRRLLAPVRREPIPMLAGMYFVLDPLNTEGVNYIVGRGILLATFFMLAALLLYLHATDEPLRVRLGAFALSVLCAALAWASHSAGILFPLLVLGVDGVVRRRKLHWPRLRLHGVYWLVAAAALIEWGADQGVAKLTQGGLSACLAACNLLPGELGSVLLPRHLLIVHHLASVPGDTWSAIVAAVVMVILAALFIMAWRKHSTLALGLFWACAGTGLVSFSARHTGVLHERELYLAGVGVAILLAWVVNLFSGIPGLSVPVGLFATVCILVGGGMTFQRNEEWARPERLWQAALNEYPDSAPVLHQLGRFYLRQGEQRMMAAHNLSRAKQQNSAKAVLGSAQDDLKLATTYLQEGAMTAPDDAALQFDYGVALFYLQDDDAALNSLENALRLDPTYKEAAIRMAMLLQSKGNSVEHRDKLVRAVDYYRLASKLGGLPDDVVPRYASALTTLGDLKGAEAQLTPLAKRGAPAAVSAQLKRVRQALKEEQKTEKQARSVLAKDPKNLSALTALAQAFSMKGRYLEASYLLEDVLAKNPNHTAAWLMLGLARAAMGQSHDFLTEWAAPPKGAQGSNWLQLARSCVSGGYWNAAVTYLSGEGAKADGITQPLVALADVAWKNAPAKRVEAVLHRACQAYPKSPVPWLRLFDFAVEHGQTDKARGYLQQAQAKGATEKDLASRRKELENKR